MDSASVPKSTLAVRSGGYGGSHHDRPGQVRTTQPNPWRGSHALGEKFHQLGLPVALVDLWGTWDLVQEGIVRERAAPVSERSWAA